MKICIECGAEFTIGRADRVLCSEKCRKIRRKRHNAKFKAKNPRLDSWTVLRFKVLERDGFRCVYQSYI